jgi:hypothetical protein
MGDVTRRMRQDFEAFFPRAIEVRATVSGAGAWSWLQDRGPDTKFDGVQVVCARIDSEGGSVEFVALVYEYAASPILRLRGLLDALDGLPGASRLLAGAEITLQFLPGR